ncbi:MAG: bifunctional hydroxymethylpyrimidine kinase/phosphomethylpyrimidine kinase [Heliobacteriaceae bacterium]|nr:bifunctional hydroxymethylpyrimidine kinase/phosphomethylpyrimidine kinase [Heliobacteriaceae bacterium]
MPIKSGTLPKVLTIAGSDPSGGAGLQADLKVMTQLGVYGAAAVAALTRQTTQGVIDVLPLPADWVLAQVADVLADLRPVAVKTGMLQNAANIRGVARLWREYVPTVPAAALVVDPVLHSGTGVSLFAPEGLAAFWEDLLPVTTIVTPNVPEAKALTGLAIRDGAGMEKAARALLASGVEWVLLKGGHLPEGEPGVISDLLASRDNLVWFKGPRTEKADLHGTGCTLAAALAAYLALGLPANAAAAAAVKWVRRGIAHPLFVGQGRGVVCQR